MIMLKSLNDPRLKTKVKIQGLRSKCRQPNVHSNVQDAFMTAMMPNGIWLNQDWDKTGLSHKGMSV